MSIDEMKNVDVRTVDPETLVDVTKIVIDESLAKEERVKEYLRQVKNPYCFKVGDVVVKCSYSNDGVTLKDRLLRTRLKSAIISKYLAEIPQRNPASSTRMRCVAECRNEAHLFSITACVRAKTARSTGDIVALV